tara:strand:- start:1648 stop:2025 length:378 start_codon:yes stop_codon:yes gene_type:complete
MNIEIEESDSKIYVAVTLPYIDKTKGERILVMLKDVEEELHRRGIKFGKCVQGRLNTLWNTNKDNLTSVWVFTKMKPSISLEKKVTQIEATDTEAEVLVKPEPVKRKRTSSRRSKKSYSKTGLVE